VLLDFDLKNGRDVGLWIIFGRNIRGRGGEFKIPPPLFLAPFTKKTYELKMY